VEVFSSRFCVNIRLANWGSFAGSTGAALLPVVSWGMYNSPDPPPKTQPKQSYVEAYSLFRTFTL